MIVSIANWYCICYVIYMSKICYETIRGTNGVAQQGKQKNDISGFGFEICVKLILFFGKNVERSTITAKVERISISRKPKLQITLKEVISIDYLYSSRNRLHIAIISSTFISPSTSFSRFRMLTDSFSTSALPTTICKLY